VVAIFSINCDFDIWVAIVSPLIRAGQTIKESAAVQGVSHRYVRF